MADTVHDELQELQTKRTSMNDELRTLNDRMTKGEGGALTERAGNLAVGLTRIDAAIQAKRAEWSAEQLAVIRKGGYSFESGDGAGDADDTPGRKGGGGTDGAGTFARALLKSGLSPSTRTAVEINAYDALKAPTWPASTDWSRSSPVLVPKGMDTRFLWPVLPSQNVGTDTSIQDFRQTARTLTGTVKRAVDATTDKASLDTTITLVNEALAQFAVVIEGIPLALFQSVSAFSAFLESEGRFQVEKAIDDHVLAQIIAATPAFGTSGTTMVEKVRNGIASMRTTGASPNVVVLNPTDAAALDLTADAGGFVFPTSSTGVASPLWNQRVVERIGAGTEPPYLIDTDMLGVLYMGAMAVDLDPYTQFKKNLVTMRVEVNALFHVRNIDGARRIAAS